MKKKLLFMLLLFCGLIQSLHAQKTVTGKITNEANKPVVGASIAEKGTTNGAISDVEGNYSLKVSENATLGVSFVGFSSKEIPNNFFSKQNATNIPQRATAIEHMELSNLAQQNSTGNATAVVFPLSLIEKYKTQPVDNIEIFNTDWTKLLLTNSGLMQNHNIVLDAGSERASLLTSLTFFDQQGLTQNTSFRKFDLRMNPDIKISDKLTLKGTLFFNNGRAIEPAGSTPEFIIRQAIGLPANAAAKLGDGQYGDAGQSNRRNPLGQVEASGLVTVRSPAMMGQANLVYQPIKGLELTASYAREQWTPHTKSFQKSYDSYNPNVTTKTWDFVSKYPGTNRL